MSEPTLREAFIRACEDELQAPKPGNVHLFCGGHGMEAQHFIDSAAVAAAPLTTPRASVGERIESAVEATFARVGQNTNLGIILLCAPLALAAERLLRAPTPAKGLREETGVVLAALDIADAAAAFRAVARANPGGLGKAPEHDVAAPATVTLLEAMRAAADRDSIARQYANGFADLFEIGFDSLARSRRAQSSGAVATLRLYLDFLAAFPDSHVQRKFGAEAATRLASQARRFNARTQALREEAPLFAAALDFDRALKQQGLNPGTSADLTVAALFADYASRILANGCKND